MLEHVCRNLTPGTQQHWVLTSGAPHEETASLPYRNLGRHYTRKTSPRRLAEDDWQPLLLVGLSSPVSSAASRNTGMETSREVGRDVLRSGVGTGEVGSALRMRPGLQVTWGGGPPSPSCARRPVGWGGGQGLLPGVQVCWELVLESRRPRRQRPGGEHWSLAWGCRCCGGGPWGGEY